MKLLAISIVLFLISVTGITAKALTPCEKATNDCPMTETEAYLKCLKNKRIKRDICPYSNDVPYAPTVVQCTTPDCGVNYVFDNCINSCSGSCNGFTCQDRCERSCKDNQVITIPQPPMIVQKDGAMPSIISPNVTTTIHLTNIVNNTNHINVPTSINNTNINNLDLGSNSSSYQQMMGGSNQKCCVVVQPRVCHNINGTNGGRRCVHRKHHMCGPQCASPVVHAQVRQPCEGPPKECPPSVAYIPQPQPRCNYVPAWPYVACGGGNQQEMPNCEGCYDHYGYGFENFHSGSAPNCFGCYDDNFMQGSLYRPGPFYRPGYYHMPPMDIAPYTAPAPCGMGCFGNQMIDPAFGRVSCSPYAGGCVPSSQYYNFAETYMPPPPVYQPPAYMPYPQYYSPQQYYTPQYYAPYQMPSAEPVQYYTPNQVYTPQSYSPLFSSGFGTLFNNTLLNGTTLVSNYTEPVFVGGRTADFNTIIPEYQPYVRGNIGYPRYYNTFPVTFYRQYNLTKTDMQP